MKGRKRAAPTVEYTLFDTAMGTCAIAYGRAGLKHVFLPATKPGRLAKSLVAKFGGPPRVQPPARWRGLIQRIARHLEGHPQNFASVTLDLAELTPFTQEIYRSLQHIGSGKTLSYSELARRAGRPAAARAVGQALARNPFPVVVPCHRVLSASGSLGGFSAPGGLVTKKKLLGLEGVDLGAAGVEKIATQPSTTLFQGATKVPFNVRQARRSLRQADDKLARLMDQVGPFRLELHRPPSTFVALAEAIVYQQLTAKAASTIYSRLRASLGQGKSFGPRAVSRATDAQLRGAGLSRNKVAALRDLAEKASAGQVPSLTKLEDLEDEEIIERLTAIRGVGEWTVQMLLIFQLGRPDVLPAGDYGVRKGAARALGIPLPTPQQLASLAQRWRPYRTMASWYLWRALELE